MLMTLMINGIRVATGGTVDVLISDKATLIIAEEELQNCAMLSKKESFDSPKMGLFLRFYSFKRGAKKHNGLMEIYRGSQGRVAMTTIYSTMTCFEFLSVLFEYVIRALLRSQIIRPAKLSVFQVCQNAHQHRKR